MSISISKTTQINSPPWSFQATRFYEGLSKATNAMKISLKYFIEASKIFIFDLYRSLFSYRIITKIPFFIFFYGFATTFGAIETIYYISLTIFVLKASKDVISSLKNRQKLKTVSEYYPIHDKQSVSDSTLKGLLASPVIIFLDSFLMKHISQILEFLNFEVFEEPKLIHQKGFVGNFASFYGIFINPFIKEVLFRGYIQTFFSEGDKSKQSSNDFIKVIFKTAIVFALFHFSPTSGWVMIPTLITYTSISIIYSLLNEQTKDLFASTAALMTFNIITTINERRLKFSKI